MLDGFSPFLFSCWEPKTIESVHVVSSGDFNWFPGSQLFQANFDVAGSAGHAGKFPDGLQQDTEMK